MRLLIFAVGLAVGLLAGVILTDPIEHNQCFTDCDGYVHYSAFSSADGE